jgi:hypothetical protein
VAGPVKAGVTSVTRRAHSPAPPGPVVEDSQALQAADYRARLLVLEGYCEGVAQVGFLGADCCDDLFSPAVAVLGFSTVRGETHGLTLWCG